MRFDGWRQMVTRVGLAAVLAPTLVACGDGPADGFQSVGTGDTYGEWELFAEAKDGEWTGCLRWDGGGVESKECTDPARGELFEVEFEDVIFGAVPDGRTLVFDDDGREVGLIDEAGLPGYEFFVVAGEATLELDE
jgi:hypothetical protein